MALTSFSFGRYGYSIGGGAIDALVVDIANTSRVFMVPAGYKGAVKTP